MRPSSATGYGLDTQRVSWDQPPVSTVYGTSQTIRAHSDKGFAVYFSASGACSVSGINTGTLRATRVGSCTITAYAPTLPVVAYAEVKATISVAKAGQWVTIGSGSVAYGQSVAFPVSSNWGLTPFTWSSLTPSTCTAYTQYGLYWIHGDYPGTCTVRATQAGNAYYASATATRTLTIPKLNQIVRIPSGLVVGVGQDLSVPIASDSGLTGFQFVPINPDYCTASVEDGQYWVHGKVYGFCYVSATQPGNGIYNSATATQAIAVNKFDQTITFPAIADRPVSAPDFTPSVWASSDLPVRLFVSGSCSSPAFNVVHMTGVGSCTVAAYQSGDETYNAAEPKSQTFLGLQLRQQTLTFPAIPLQIPFSTFDIAPPTTNSGLPIRLSAGPSDVCWFVSPSPYRLSSGREGTCTITATQEGNDQWAPATVSRTFYINRAWEMIYDPTLPNSLPGKDLLERWKALDKPLDVPVGTALYLSPHFRADSGLPLTFSADGQCFIRGDYAYPTNAQFGACYITASHGETDQYLAAATTRVFTIGTLGQKIADVAIGEEGNTGCKPNPGESATVRSWTPYYQPWAFVDSGDWSYFWRATAKPGETPKTKSRYDGSSCQGNQWCALFASWVWQRVDPNSPYEWSVPAWKSYADTHNMWTNLPAVGDLVIYKNSDLVADDNPEGLAHVAVVTAVSVGSVRVVGGNENWPNENGPNIDLYPWPYSRNTVVESAGDAFEPYLSILGYISKIPLSGQFTQSWGPGESGSGGMVPAWSGTPILSAGAVDMEYFMMSGGDVRSASVGVATRTGSASSLALFAGPFDGDVDLRLYRPDGSLVDSNDPNLTYTKTGDTVQVSLAVAEPGTWRYEIVANQLNASTEIAVWAGVAENITTAVTADLKSTQYGDPITLTASITSPIEGQTVAGAVQFAVDGTDVGDPVAIDADGEAIWTTDSLEAGTHSISIRYVGSTPNISPTSEPLDVEVTRADQTISLESPGDKTYGDADLNLSATASSGLSVSFAASGQCTIGDGNVHLTGAGTCTIIASQPGDARYNAATDATVTFAIAKQALTITANNAGKPFGETLTFAGREFTATGLVAGDSVTSVALSSAGQTAEAVPGSYEITVSAAAGFGLDNYEITYVSGQLTVISAEP
jgi:hypothetical protein